MTRERRTVVIHIHLTEKEKAALDMMAESEDISRSEMVRKLIREGLERRGIYILVSKKEAFEASLKKAILKARTIT